MSKTTERVDLDAELEAQISTMTDEQVDEVYAGAPESFSDAGPESPEYRVPEIAASDPSPAEITTDKVHLVNLRYNNEVVFLPNDDGKWTGRTVQFSDGHLIVDRETADTVLAAAPYVYEEPKTGEVFTHDATGFSTRNSKGYAEYVKTYYANL